MSTTQQKVRSLFRFYEVRNQEYKPPEKFPEYSDPNSNTLKRGITFSVFVDAHNQEAERVYNHLISLDKIDEFFDTCESFKLFLNEGLYLYAVTVALLHRRDTAALHIPPLWKLNTRAYFKSAAINRAYFKAKFDTEVLPTIKFDAPSQKKAAPDEILPHFITGDYRDPEYDVAWWREDIGLNAHHYHWHQVYPFRGVNGVIKDRQGELFYYMHQQMLARYDADRIAVGLPRVEAYDNWDAPIPEGYDAHLTDYYGSNQFSPRPSNMTLRDCYFKDEGKWLYVSRQRYHYAKILDAVNTGVIFGEDLKPTPLNIVNLGAAVEASIASPNKQLYGNLHNTGHIMLSLISDTDGRYNQAPGVMMQESVSIRDPIFFRWHKFLDNIFVMHKEFLDPYKEEELLFQDIKVKAVDIVDSDESDGKPKPKVPITITTRMDNEEIDISKDMFIIKPADNSKDIKVVVQRVNYDHFSYKFTVDNGHLNSVEAAFRIFLAPRKDQMGALIPFVEQRRLFMEMDKFPAMLNPGTNTITRLSTSSSVLQPPDLTDENEPSDECNSCENRDQRYCSCGWPHNMLIPRGTEVGMEFDLFVMITNWETDKVATDSSDNLNRGTSYCGIKDRKYPDTRAMGFPFDRKFDNNKYKHICDLTKDFDNMKTTHITVRYIKNSSPYECACPDS